MTHEAVRRGGTKPAWKFYYETRNLVHYRLHVQFRQVVSVARQTKAAAHRIPRDGAYLLREDDKVVKLRAVVREFATVWRVVSGFGKT